MPLLDTGSSAVFASLKLHVCLSCRCCFPAVSIYHGCKVEGFAKRCLGVMVAMVCALSNVCQNVYFEIEKMVSGP